MKRILQLIAVAGLLVAVSPALAEKMTAGPKGGRLLENEWPRAEFYVEEDHHVSLTFYDANLKPIPLAEQTAAMIVEAKSGKVKIEFEKKGDVLVSKTPLPEGDGFMVVVQLRNQLAGKLQNFRIKYDSAICTKCKRPEYACICDE